MWNKFKKIFLRKKLSDTSAFTKVVIIENQKNADKQLYQSLKGRFDFCIIDESSPVMDKIKQYNPNLIILISSESGEKALNICQKIRSNQATKAIPILVIADQGAAKIIEYYVCNVEGYLINPVAVNDFIKYVRMLVDNENAEN